MAQQANHPLPNGHRLDPYTIVRQLSVGGFSIVYLAIDDTGQQFAIKEYLPHSLALRGAGQIEPQISEAHQGAFRYGMKCFFEEGRALAMLSHPNVVRVVNFFRANQTVYLVMVYEHGRTLQELASHYPENISERFLRGLFTRALNGLREVHAHKLLHLDLKPSNIYLRADNTPVLIDFGAARQTLHLDQPMLKPMYTPGYASPEHYGDRQDLGPWSDLYSIGAAMYACLAGGPPPAADLRLSDDHFESARLRWAGRFSPDLLSIIDWCLCLDHLARPQSALALQKRLIEHDSLQRPSVPTTPPPEPPPAGLLGRLRQALTRKPAP